MEYLKYLKSLDLGINSELKTMLNDDLQLMEYFNVKNEKEKDLLFKLDFLYDGMIDNLKIAPANKYDLLKEVFNSLKDRDKLSLNDIKNAFILKKSYNNINGVMKENVGKQHNIKYWVDVFKYIWDMVSKGEDINDVKNRVMEDWSPMDKEQFNAWMRYYSQKEHEKYASIFDTDLENSQLIQTNRQNQQLEIQKNKEKTQEDLKKTLIGRLNSAERLLYQFVNVWPSDIFNRLYRGLSDLKGEIMLMRTSATLTDRIVRLANVWEKEGFVEGAQELKKIAEPDLASQISDALSGKSESKEVDVSAAPEGVDEPLPDMEQIPDIQQNEKFNIEELPKIEDLSKQEDKKDINIGEQEKFDIEDLPKEEPLKEEPPKDEPKELNVKEKFNVSESDNPFVGSSVEDVLNILEPLSQSLRERDFSLKLSKADMMLDSMNMASHFPEIGEISQKALEFNIYANSRLEKVISKLKGGIKENEEDKGKSDGKIPNIEMEELKSPKGAEEEKIMEMLK